MATNWPTIGSSWVWCPLLRQILWGSYQKVLDIGFVLVHCGITAASNPARRRHYLKGYAMSATQYATYGTSESGEVITSLNVNFAPYGRFRTTAAIYLDYYVWTNAALENRFADFIDAPADVHAEMMDAFLSLPRIGRVTVIASIGGRDGHVDEYMWADY